MRFSFIGVQLISVLLASLLLVSCGLSSLGIGDGRRGQVNLAQIGDAPEQQAEIERLVQTSLAVLTQTARTDDPAWVVPTLSPTGDRVGDPTYAPTTSENSERVVPTPSPTVAPTQTPTSPPENARLSGFTHLYQNMNNCGPAALAMALSYWGWPEDLEDYLRDGRQRELQDAIARALKPEPQDKNVGPPELAAYIEQATPFKARVRAAGDLELLQHFIAAGFPVIVQRGLDSYVWLGHYQVVSGYEDSRQLFYVYDSYLGPSNAIPTPYQELLQDWRAFNFTYLVVYPAEHERVVDSILGAQQDLDYNRSYAADLALLELAGLDGRDLFFGWYNLGTSLVELEDFQAAASAFDQALTLYQQLPLDGRPWRMLWYQIAPYPAYYYTARYADLQTLATRTIEEAYEPAKPGGPFIEESFYWRGMAYAAQGLGEEALADFSKALELNPSFSPAADGLASLNGD
jgi:tetratricopeptide (TPR) repeat protein